MTGATWIWRSRPRGVAAAESAHGTPDEELAQLWAQFASNETASLRQSTSIHFEDIRKELALLMHKSRQKDFGTMRGISQLEEQLVFLLGGLENRFAQLASTKHHIDTHLKVENIWVAARK